MVFPQPCLVSLALIIKINVFKSYYRCLPMNFDKGDLAGSGILRDRQRAGASLADIDPMNIDRSVSPTDLVDNIGISLNS